MHCSFVVFGDPSGTKRWMSHDFAAWCGNVPWYDHSLLVAKGQTIACVPQLVRIEQGMDWAIPPAWAGSRRAPTSILERPYWALSAMI